MINTGFLRITTENAYNPVGYKVNLNEPVFHILCKICIIDSVPISVIIV